MSHKVEGGVQILEAGTRGMNARIVLGDVLTIVGIVVLSILGMYLGLPNSKVRRIYFVAYLAWVLFILIKFLLHKEPLTLGDRFFLLLFSAVASLSSLVRAVIHSWDEKPPVFLWISGISWLVIAAYQFFVFSSKDLRERQ